MARWAYHAWDLEVAMERWPQGYRPGPSDLSHARFLQRVFYQLMQAGRLGEGWAATDQAPGWPENYATMVIEPERPAVREGYMAEVCAFLEEAGLGQRAWWVN